MKTKVFSIYDSKAQMFNLPFFMVTTPAALRSFSDLVNDPQTMINKHPGDFVLYEIGEYDDSTAKMENYKEHHHLGIASQFKEDKKPFAQREVEALGLNVVPLKNGEEK